MGSVPGMRPPLIALAKKPSSDLQARIDAREAPRAEYLELQRRLGTSLLDFHDVERSRHPLVKLANQRLGPRFGLAMRVFLSRHQYGQIYATGEDIGIPLGMLFKAARVRSRITMVVHNAGTPKRRTLLRSLGSRVWQNVICLGTEQRRVLIEECGLPPELVHMRHNWIDTRFYAPADAGFGPGEFVLAVGMEQRDYPTLQRAAVGLNIPFHVVASGWSPGAGYAAAEGLREQEGFTIGSGYSNDELKSLYARARFVAVPIRKVTYAAGVTAILEAFAMGKAVLASGSPGILDYVADGVSGRVVPVGDVAAMREALQALWNDPQACSNFGRRNRAWADEVCSTDRYVERVAELLHLPVAPASPGAPRAA